MKCYDFTAEANERIVIASPSGSSDGYGGQAAGFTTQSEVWADVKPLSDFQKNQSAMLQSMISHQAIIRYQSALADIKTTSKYRVTLDSRTYDIVGVKNVDESLKKYGKAFQILVMNENGPDV